uniref:Uncharacterized protein n=1 Tax=Odontella aurita TaxID=265563 RepID=A0A7S4N9E0_9STRA|mmetsp:Transcript_54234/g.162371  ORF Transcript_54234/g.162371 Transcript_54234/m.162371 type:complete len:183 (+) Transcript_54234:175-723(+)|eukprot:CAMPEP_0113560224 /NCGR_PEP_ID=MMETSP0015_2-20120614/19315_1 /TAXON_ID=2838 /ORGANISM="Odontella" /LENGTH=182 /DNA_ID=CAMNT_0000461911 /DNA_START=171 /DNA_END=722 /DNA_ORIENTATION=- /assembly_acc=CAM_ASM_000160
MAGMDELAEEFGNAGPIAFQDPSTQMQIIGLYEQANVMMSEVDESRTVANLPKDEKKFFLAEFNEWTVRRDGCGSNKAGKISCGRDVKYESDGSKCEGTWVKNEHDLTLKSDDAEVGICLPVDMMRADDLADLQAKGIIPPSGSSWCPVYEGWSEAKSEHCLQVWHELKGSTENKSVPDEEL